MAERKPLVQVNGALSEIPVGDTVSQSTVTDLQDDLAGTKSYTHIQSSPSDSWVVTYNLNRFPSAVSVLDSAGSVSMGHIVHDSVNQLTINFGTTFSGRVEVR